MKLEQLTATRADGKSGVVSHFKSSYSSSLQLSNLQITSGNTYTLHGYVKSAANTTVTCLDKSATSTTSWQEISFIISPTQNFLKIYFAPGEFWIYNWKLEKGSIKSLWTPAPDDITSEFRAVHTEYSQLADKFTWIVSSGTDKSSMVLTDSFYNLISKNINLTGKVNFNSFDTAFATEYTTVKSTANTANSNLNNYVFKSGTTTIDGGNIATGSITAKQLNVNEIIVGRTDDYFMLDSKDASTYTGLSPISGADYISGTISSKGAIVEKVMNSLPFVLTPRLPWTCKSGDQFRFHANLQNYASSNISVSLALRVYANSDAVATYSGNSNIAVQSTTGSSSSSSSVQTVNLVTFTATAGLNTYEYSVKIPASSSFNFVPKYFDIVIVKSTATRLAIIDGASFCKKINGSIIVTGTITSDMIKAQTLTGININNGNGTFKVDANGNLTATKATIGGKITSDNPNTLYSTVINDGIIYTYGTKNGSSLLTGTIASGKPNSESSSNYDTFGVVVGKNADAMSFGIYYDEANLNYYNYYIMNNGRNPDGITDRHIWCGDECHQGVSKYYVNNTNFTGAVRSFENGSTKRVGVELYCDQGDLLSLSCRQSATSNLTDPVIQIDQNTYKTDPPWIRNTASGTLDVIIGLSWGGGSMKSVDRAVITVKNGLITGWTTKTNYF